jgi:hypothetical protein
MASAHRSIVLAGPRVLLAMVASVVVEVLLALHQVVEALHQCHRANPHEVARTPRRIDLVATTR